MRLRHQRPTESNSSPQPAPKFDALRASPLSEASTGHEDVQQQLDVFNIPIDVSRPVLLESHPDKQRIVGVTPDVDDPENIFFTAETIPDVTHDDLIRRTPQTLLYTAEALQHFMSPYQQRQSDRSSIKSELFAKMVELKDKKPSLQIFTKSRTQSTRNPADPRVELKPNEDRIFQFKETGVYSVIDGMGGYRGGAKAAEIASKTCLEYISRSTTVTESKKKLVSAIENANRDINHLSGIDPERYGGMGAVLTFTQIVEQEDGKHFAWASVGDTRVYVKHGKSIKQLTTDECIGSGATNCVGVNGAFKGVKDFNIGSIKLESGMRILLCSDGIVGDYPWQALTDQEISAALEINNPDEALKALFRKSRKNDDTTGLIIDVVPDEHTVMRDYIAACNPEFAKQADDHTVKVQSRLSPRGIESDHRNTATPYIQVELDEAMVSQLEQYERELAEPYGKGMVETLSELRAGEPVSGLVQLNEGFFGMKLTILLKKQGGFLNVEDTRNKILTDEFLDPKLNTKACKAFDNALEALIARFNLTIHGNEKLSALSSEQDKDRVQSIDIELTQKTYELLRPHYDEVVALSSAAQERVELSAFVGSVEYYTAIIFADLLDKNGRLKLNDTLKRLESREDKSKYERNLLLAWDRVASIVEQHGITHGATAETEPSTRPKLKFEKLIESVSGHIGINPQKIHDGITAARSTAKEDLNILKERAEKAGVFYKRHEKEIVAGAAIVGALALRAAIKRSKRR